MQRLDVAFLVVFFSSIIGGIIYAQNYRPSRERVGRIIGASFGIIAAVSAVAECVMVGGLDFGDCALILLIPVVLWIIPAYLTWGITNSNAFGSRRACCRPEHAAPGAEPFASFGRIAYRPPTAARAAVEMRETLI